MDGGRRGLMRVVVTGAAGFSGRHASERLALAGMEITAVVSPRAPAAGRRPVAGAAVELACDLTDRASVRSLLDRVRPDAVLHLAGRNAVDESWRAPDLALAANLLSTVYVLEAARALPDCRTLVIGSMLSPRPDEDLTRTLHPYGFSKALQVTAALAWQHWYGQQVIVAEPCNLIGPGGSAGICGKIARWAAACERDAERGREPAPFRLSSLEERRDFLDVRDAAAAYATLLRTGGAGRPLRAGVRHAAQPRRGEGGVRPGEPRAAALGDRHGWRSVAAGAARGRDPRARLAASGPVRAFDRRYAAVRAGAGGRIGLSILNLPEGWNRHEQPARREIRQPGGRPGRSPAEGDRRHSFL
ncbi:NAD-dependent epimerase/dehydratase family protein [Cohnella rhizosphaerae]|uniref:NAD-dependent epimerase/dehydratase family protein n=1 Tax=Cohnella rhizosphaerae TaxID=1457232 RepID=A0A9X4L6A0_9BACL|nr:NAD-dependent epimerase/dehydratase family protein [Cohnella rhizosphaerae]MDG0814689.1 NAD-dependent epimerase/dehydratase family protein [Cohnella rhizosphaerae]